ncbi:hypothetical protein ACFE04_028126 [Oxalis oulophora]
MSSKMSTNVVTTILLLLIFFFFFFISLSVADQIFTTSQLDSSFLTNKQQKLTHFKVYWHDIYSGKNPTVVQVVMPPKNSNGFGSVAMIDDPLTMKPDVNSKLVGRAQGFYAVAAQHEVGLLMSMNFAFMEGKYNGSTIAILGKNSVLSKVREMSVVGGSGLFRFARGYVEARTNQFDIKTGDAIVEYSCSVLHY